ncbi:hypothetical protein MUP32_02525 [Candidatus Microgenomates bacterium]|nr:hypothetical protein [Candidatus Microgenomates bacterium]
MRKLIIVTFFSSISFFLSFFVAGPAVWAQNTEEQRAVWLQDDNDLTNKLQKLKEAHFNTVYFGIWGAKNSGLQNVIDKVHSFGLHIHLWEANAFICAGQWLTTCTNNTQHADWFAKLSNSMTRKDLTGDDNWFDFGVPAAKQYQIDTMVNYAKNYNADGIHYDYIRYDWFGNYSFSQYNMDQFKQRYGIDGAIIRGDKFPAFASLSANRVTNPTTATVLANFDEKIPVEPPVPAILLNNYKNGKVLTFNWQAFKINFKVADEVLKRTINQFGTNLKILSVPNSNGGTEGAYNLTTNWTKYLGFSPVSASIDGIGSLPAGSTLIIPGIYSFTDAQILSLDQYLANGGNLIFIDGPVTSVYRSSGQQQTFKNILGVNGAGSYIGGNTLITIPESAKTHALINGLVGTHTLTFTQASSYIDKWREYMQGTITAVIKGVYEQVHALKPNMQISGAFFPAEDQGNLTVHQNWPLWVANGWVNYPVLMGYTLDTTTFTNRINWLKNNNLQNRAIIGLDAYEITSCDQITTVINQIQKLRDNGFKGFSVFSSNDMTQAGYKAADCGILTSLKNKLATDVSPYYPDSSCPLKSSGDFNCDGKINESDLNALLGKWMTGEKDITEDGIVNESDLNKLLGNWKTI